SLSLLLPLHGFAEAGHPLEGSRDVGHLVPAREGDAVPLVESVDLELVAGLLERLDRELVGAALDLLHGENVDILAYEPVDHSAESGADRVDVPGGDAHIGGLLRR